MIPSVETQIWLALKSRIDTLPLIYPKAWPAKTFTAPTDGYIRVGAVSAEPNPELIAEGKKHTRRGYLMMTLVMPMRYDSSVFTEQAGQIASHFSDGTAVRYGSICVTITSAPHVVDGYEDGGYWNVPIRIPWRTFA